MANNFANDPDVVALYRFESGALTTDSSGNGNTLTDINTVAEDTTNEKEGACCADFTKANYEVLYCTDANLSSNFPLKSGTSNKKFTISAWIRLKSVDPAGTYYGIFSKHGYGLSSFWMGFNGNEKLMFVLGYNNGDSEEVSSRHATALSTNTWYHVTVSYDDSDKSYAIRVRDADGSVVGTDLTGNTTNNINVENGIMGIGAVNYSGGTWIHCFDGLIDELVVFKRVLTADEVTDIAKGQYTPFETYEESVSDLFKASDSQASLLKLEFANSDSFKLSEGILAIGKFPKSISDLFKVSDSLVNSTKFSNSASDLIKLLDLSSSAKGYIENISDLFKVSEGLSPYKREVLADSPAVYYRLGELEGSIAYDSSGNEKHLSYPESGVTKGANGLVAGDNKAALFDGSSRAKENNYDPGEKTAITLEVWCKASVLNVSHNIVFNIGTTGHYIALVKCGENPYTLFSIRVSEIQKRLYCYNKVMSVDEVYHIVATWESGDYQKVYINGVEIGRSESIVSGTLNSSAGVELAAFANSYFFNGAIDEVAVYETALSPERVAAHYRAGKIGEAPVINFIESVSDKALFVDSSTGNLIIALSVSDAAKFIDSSIVAGKLIVAVSEEFKLSDFTDGKKKTQFSISDIFKLSDLGVTKKLSSEDVSDFLRVIDNGESVKRAILEVSDKFKMSDYSIFMTLDDLGLVAIKLVYRGKNFLTLKERKDFTFKNRTSFFTTKKE